jgi:hypothetical protein
VKATDDKIYYPDDWAWLKSGMQRLSLSDETGRSVAELYRTAAAEYYGHIDAEIREGYASLKRLRGVQSNERDGVLITHREFMELPLETRRAVMERQSKELAESGYTPNEEDVESEIDWSLIEG